MGLLRQLARWTTWRGTLTIQAGVGRGLRFTQPGARINYAAGTNELPVQNALARILRPGDVFLDIGANIGFLTVIAARLVGPAGRVVAFEPVPANAAVVRRNAALNAFTHVTVVESAVAATPGQVELILARHPGGAALSSAGAPPDAAGSIEVQAVSIDELIATGRIPEPSAIKLDVEGAEFEALIGMEQTIRRRRPILLVEFDDARPRAVEAKRRRFEAFAQDRGYRTSTLDPEYTDSGWSVIHILAEPAPAPPAPAQ